MADWKSNLGEFFEEKESAEVRAGKRLAQLKAEAPEFLRTVVLPAFNELKEQLEKRDRQVQVRGSGESASIEVKLKDVREIYYGIKIIFWTSHAHPYVVTKMREGRGESFIKRGSEDSINNITKEDIIADFLRLYQGQVGRSTGV